jgi:hypothetical protein
MLDWPVHRAAIQLKCDGSATSGLERAHAIERPCRATDVARGLHGSDLVRMFAEEPQHSIRILTQASHVYRVPNIANRLIAVAWDKPLATHDSDLPVDIVNGITV